MQITNSKNGFGLVSILVHWSMALMVIGLYVLGDYMVELDYYSKWYNTAPYWHKAVGMIAFFLLLFRIIWVFSNTKPEPLSSYKHWEKIAAKITHYAFYVLLLLLSVSGYFITTSKGAPIEIFNWFNIPAIMNLETNIVEIMEEIHEISAEALMILFFLHVGATLKHQFIDKDITLKRMLIPTTSNSINKETQP